MLGLIKIGLVLFAGMYVGADLLDGGYDIREAVEYASNTGAMELIDTLKDKVTGILGSL